MFSLIVAVGENNEIGKNNQLLWHIPEDLKNFKKITMGKTVIMGKNTYKSIGKPLPNRKNIVLSRNPLEIEEKIKDVNFSDKNADTYFPKIDLKKWVVITKENYDGWRFCIYEKISG